MTRLLEQALDAVKELTPEEQDEIARTILGLVGKDGEETYILSDEENAAIDRSLKAAERGEFAADEEVAALFARYRA